MIREQELERVGEDISNMMEYYRNYPLSEHTMAMIRRDILDYSHMMLLEYNILVPRFEVSFHGDTLIVNAVKEEDEHVR